MSLHLDVPDELVDAITERVLERVRAEQDSNVSPFLDKHGAAAYLRTTASAIETMVKRGQLEPCRRRPRLLFERVELERYGRGEIG